MDNKNRRREIGTEGSAEGVEQKGFSEASSPMLKVNRQTAEQRCRNFGISRQLLPQGFGQSVENDGTGGESAIADDRARALDDGYEAVSDATAAFLAGLLFQIAIERFDAA